MTFRTHGRAQERFAGQGKGVRDDDDGGGLPEPAHTALPSSWSRLATASGAIAMAACQSVVNSDSQGGHHIPATVKMTCMYVQTVMISYYAEPYYVL